jgi:hypothetical protein
MARVELILLDIGATNQVLPILPLRNLSESIPKLEVESIPKLEEESIPKLEEESIPQEGGE